MTSEQSPASDRPLYVIAIPEGVAFLSIVIAPNAPTPEPVSLPLNSPDTEGEEA